jgi:hypothetical protein
MTAEQLLRRAENMIKKILHKIAHLCKWNGGRCEAFWVGDKLMMSFRCSGCGKRQDIHEVAIRPRPDWHRA